jgi:hypothetical protein
MGIQWLVAKEKVHSFLSPCEWFLNFVGLNVSNQPNKNSVAISGSDGFVCYVPRQDIGTSFFDPPIHRQTILSFSFSGIKNN